MDFLLWVKENIFKFVEYYINKCRIDSMEIIVKLEDNKRKRVYKRGLEKDLFAYKYFLDDGVSKKFLYKKFIRGCL